MRQERRMLDQAFDAAETLRERKQLTSLEKAARTGLAPFQRGGDGGLRSGKGKRGWPTPAWAGFIGLVLAASAGCGSAGPVTHEVQGQVQLTDGDINVLAGHSVEAALQSDPQVRAYGEIKDDGSFTLETLHGGEIHPGALEGKYKARIVLGDDDPEASRRIAAGIDPKFFEFDKSGLTIDVPAAGDVKLSILRR